MLYLVVIIKDTFTKEVAAKKTHKLSTCRYGSLSLNLHSLKEHHKARRKNIN